MIWLIVAGVILWYGVGMLGSAIAFGSIYKSLGKLSPSYPSYSKFDKAFGYLLAACGLFNVGGAIVFSLANTRSITLRWEWLK